MKKGKRLLISLLFCGMAFLIVGCGSKSVKLLNKEEMLINLDAAINNAELGKEGSKTALQGEAEQETLNESEAKIQNSEKQNKETYRVIVQWETIKFEDKECKDIEELKEFIIQHCTKESEVSLQDDGAEAHVYRDVLEMIRDMQGEIGFSFLDNNT